MIETRAQAVDEGRLAEIDEAFERINPDAPAPERQ